VPQITLADALRYFFSPAAFYFYLCMYDINIATKWQQQLSVAGTVAGLVFGSVVYFLYRFYIYDTLIIWLHMRFRKINVRYFIQDRYALAEKPRSFRAVRRAQKLYYNFDDDRLKQPNRLLRGGSIHLLYQAGLLALPFFALAIWNKGLLEISFFGGCAIILLVAATGMDFRYEDEELMIVKTALDKLDQAAEVAGYRKNARQGPN
jgi:hypothetical protein